MIQKLQRSESQKQIDHSNELKRSLIDFVYDAEGDLATALESFSAEQLSRWAKPNLAGLNRTELAVDMFLTEGSVGTKSVIDFFIQETATLSADEKTLLKGWQQGFNGLFVVRCVEASETAAESYTLMNWLTEKQYQVCPTDEQSCDLLARMSVGEIVMTRLLPIGETGWMLSGPLTLLGKLGKPKLAVAIGNFKKWFPHHLYGDAPGLKAAAWDSVRQQYEDFVELFGGEQVTMSGHELNKKFQRYQEKAAETQMAAAGIDSSKSLKENVQKAGISEEEIDDAMAALGEESAAAKTLMESPKAMKMVMPKASLPDEFRSAVAVTVFVHPRWGQTLRKDYASFEAAIAASDDTPETQETIDRFTQKYLEDEQVNAHVWHSIVDVYAKPLEASLQRVLNNPDFRIERDLDDAIARYDKPLEPTLPESASVPVHLHNLFQEAIAAVGKAEKPKKGKKKAKKKSGFG
ncbi:MAG: hypothetical protein AAF703_01000 [Cyanobacteria bacterium P01_D01_bin.105]